jgi:hypothetical protein
MIDAAGVGYSQQVVASAGAVASGNNLATLQALVNNTVQPSAAQLTGLKKYLSLIQAASDTSTVETTLAGL